MKKKAAQDVYETKNLLPLELQFFAAKDDDDEEDGKGDSEDDSDDDDDSNDDSNTDQKKKSGEKTFTQSQVNKMMSREKKEGKASILKSLGFKSEADAKKAIKMLNALNEAQQTEEDKKEELENKRAEAEKRALAAENKLSCLAAGVTKDSLEDALAIALLKVTEEKDLDTVLAEMKGQQKYSGFFNSGEEEKDADKGTGNDPGHSSKKGKEKDKKGDYGTRLAEKNKSAGANKKKSYFG